MGACVVLVTVQNQAQGRQIGEALVAERLAACVNQVPGIWSIYHWQGRIEREPEELLIIKTREALLPQIIARVKDLHSYQVPEIIALPILGGSQAYLDWVTEETKA